MQLLHGVLDIDRLDATRRRLRPHAGVQRQQQQFRPAGAGGAARMHIDRLQIGAAVAGQNYLLSAAGSGALDSDHRRRTAT